MPHALQFLVLMAGWVNRHQEESDRLSPRGESHPPRGTWSPTASAHRRPAPSTRGARQATWPARIGARAETPWPGIFPRRGFCTPRDGFSRHVLRSDLVTHHAPPALRRRRAADRPAGEAVGRAVESSAPECPAAATESAGGVAGDETGSVARLGIGLWPVASAPPEAVKEWCCACSTSARDAVCNMAFNSIKAWQSTTGVAVRRR